MKLLSKLLLVCLLLSFGLSNAQINPEKKANRISKKMKKALSLSKKETKDIYELQYNMVVKGNEIREKYADQPELKKKMLTQHGKDIYNQLKAYLGPERLKQWREWKKQNK